MRKSDFMTTEEEKIYFFAWLNTKGIGPASLMKIRDHYGSFKFAWEQEKRGGLNGSLAQWQEHRLNNPQFITMVDDDYPEILKDGYPEPLLYYRGNLNLLTTTCLAIIGSRRLDNYNAPALKKIFQDLNNSGLTIVSGLAYGIDALAHQLALEHNLPTIAVLGTPISDQEIYPQSNLGLAKNILKANGLIISPFSKNSPVDRINFPRRNQTIASLVKSVLIVSAAVKSGALITARLAADINREVMAIPGNINQPLSEGSNYLLQQGAHLITSGRDILEIMGLPVISPKQTDKYQSANPLEKQIIEILKNGSQEINELLRKLSTDNSTVRSTISQLELNNWIEKKPGNIIELK